MRSCRSLYSSLDALALEARERAQPQLEDGDRLSLGELEVRHQSLLRLVGVRGGADQPDHLVEVVEGDQEALQDVGALLRLAQLVLRAARHDLALEVEEVREQLEQRQRAWDAVDERDGVERRTSICSGVCLKSLFSATCGTASRFNSTWMRMPVRSE